MHIWLDPVLYQQLGISPHVFVQSNICHWAAEGDRNGSDATGAHSNGLSNRWVDGYTGNCEGDPPQCDTGNDDNHPSFIEGAISPTSLQERVMSLWDHELHCAQDLYLARCNDTHWLACNPMRQGIVVVLDEEALALLELFCSTHNLKDLAKQWANDAEYDLGQPSMMHKAQVVALFVALGLIIDDCQCESYAPAFFVQESRTLSAWLHVTNACNLACSYCYVSKSMEHMAEDVGKRSVDAVFRSAICSDYQQVRLKYAGGEALLRLPQVLELHAYALQQAERLGLQLSATLLSNGAALTPRAIQQLKRCNIGVMISLDGVGADHDAQRPLLNGMGSFRLVDRAITRLLANDLVPYIYVVVSHRNLFCLPDLVAYLL
jgi:uncharacterized protein